MKNTFGSLLRKWRKQRKYSQLQLAIELDISSKHISFIETGRSMPSRQMILKIGSFLYLPKQEINRGLYAAGYAPVYIKLSTDDLKPVLKAIDAMLANHMPYPALVLNQYWDVVQVNESAQLLLVDLGFASHKNLVEAIINDEPKTSKIINWRETALAILEQLRHEITIIGGSKRLEELEEKLSNQLKPLDDIVNIEAKQPVLSINFRLGNQIVSFFSIISQLSNVQDPTVSEFKVELMFPADEMSENYYKKHYAG